MVTENHYRWDFIGLSTDQKPTPATSNKVVDGSTFYCSNNSKLYVWCKTQWYEKIGGASINVVQTTGTSTSNVMSQKAVSDTIDERLDELTLLTISQTDYDNLQNYDANTLYIITGA